LQMPAKVLIDCDLGIDRALALLLAHGSASIDLVGVTTVPGNVNNLSDRAIQ
jgi:purine nucleosidase